MKVWWAVVILVASLAVVAGMVLSPPVSNNKTVVAVDNGFNCGYSNKLTEHWNLLLNEGLPKEEVYLCVRKAR